MFTSERVLDVSLHVDELCADRLFLELHHHEALEISEVLNLKSTTNERLVTTLAKFIQTTATSSCYDVVYVPIWISLQNRNINYSEDK